MRLNKNKPSRVLRMRQSEEISHDKIERHLIPDIPSKRANKLRQQLVEALGH
jgi:hypothetical protein